MISRTVLTLGLLGCAFLSGCGQSEMATLSADGSGNQGERSGSMTYTDENGKPVTTPYLVLPWSKSVPMHDGQPISVSVRGSSPLQQYSVEITVGHNSDDRAVKASNRGFGGQDVTCTYPPTPATPAPKTGSTATNLMRIRIIDGDLPALKALIESGADVNAQTEEGNTALTAAAEYGRLDAAQYLLDKGAKIDLATIKNNTPLCFAAMKNQVAIVFLLCQKGANVNTRTADGGCALNFAAAAGNTNIVQTLLQFKADPTVTQNNGGTAYKLAVQNGFTATAQVLKDAGGQ